MDEEALIIKQHRDALLEVLNPILTDRHTFIGNNFLCTGNIWLTPRQTALARRFQKEAQAQ